ncbi:hypothetical protein [Amycolatopsis pithecellobii]|uniref:Uncharacterized protein n=1 Tax=Amycolatopsis pithecellobii TaxID=664692 RepID=A0A6N7Z7L7_9PSEU|nr:hypothetical protein [Amycolatopsis pithecellobii]MTD56006.1 hypothetical protein [Amycolatopsis pithecellobii]
MTVRIGDATRPGRRRDRYEDQAPATDRRRAAVGAPRRQRHVWWYHIEFALRPRC